MPGPQPRLASAAHEQGHADAGAGVLRQDHRAHDQARQQVRGEGDAAAAPRGPRLLARWRRAPNSVLQVERLHAAAHQEARARETVRHEAGELCTYAAGAHGPGGGARRRARRRAQPSEPRPGRGRAAAARAAPGGRRERRQALLPQLSGPQRDIAEGAGDVPPGGQALADDERPPGERPAGLRPVGPLAPGADVGGQPARLRVGERGAGTQWPRLLAPVGSPLSTGRP
mmetsp:Transcript_32954/g.78209  ORF Transcript_32954/g.78209 Transcript_32954/m.78209 type:complete len:229 (+) Transcript_32954:1735-2421(+)